MGTPRTCIEFEHAGDFVSTTTVTGLPPVPSRKPSMHPQASRACVNPLSIELQESYYIASEQALDLAIELRLRCNPEMPLADLPVPTDEE